MQDSSVEAISIDDSDDEFFKKNLLPRVALLRGMTYIYTGGKSIATIISELRHQQAGKSRAFRPQI